MPDDSLRFLTLWYRARCNGWWEHGKGITIETLATPGWVVSIDLAETPLEDVPMSPHTARRSDKDWITCRVEHNQFRGEGDPEKLLTILDVFRAWATQNSK